MTSRFSRLFTHAIDYAGLFPPAGLAMQPMVRNFREYALGPFRHWLGRLMIPWDRLDEFRAKRLALAAPDQGDSPWRIGCLLPEFQADSQAHWMRAHDAVSEFNRGQSRAQDPHTVIDSLEFPCKRADSLATACSTIGRELSVFVEIGWDQPPDAMVSAVVQAGWQAKIRTGGVTPEAIPPPARVAQFLRLANSRHVAFKATAGLHHPLTARRPLTYEAGSPQGSMFGFVNLLLATALATDSQAPMDSIIDLLQEQDATAIRWHADGVDWQGHELDWAELEQTRRSRFVSFGSCSFVEPVEDLAALGWL